jgi:hypothetical protein
MAMYALRRIFLDGPDRPELVLLHYSIAREDDPDNVIARATRVVPPTSEPGKRETWIYLPKTPPGGRLLVNYFFSTVTKGKEWFSTAFKTAVPGDDVVSDLVRLGIKETGNLLPAPGMGMFRIRLPLGEDDPVTGNAHYGFGAMRKKPSPDLCRAWYPMAGRSPVIEIPSALSVLKNRPMPFFLYCMAGDGGRLSAHKINCARITLRDDSGDILCARMLWGDPAWAAQNITVMELKNFESLGGKARDNYFTSDREAFLRERSEAIMKYPLPRTYEGYVFGPEKSVVEYCFQVLVRRPDGTVTAGWRNREDGNWTVVL